MARIILTTGGTGGHIFPALATAEALRQIRPDVVLLFIGSAYGPEGRMAMQANMPFLALPSRGFLGRGLRAIPAAFDMAGAIMRALAKTRQFKPCAVAAFGGYASFAPALAARLLKIPLLLHEQNAIAGTSNKIVGKWAKTVCVSLPETAGLRVSQIVTGNPVRANISAGSNGRDFSSKHLFVLGGSQGAHILNEYIVSILPQLKAADVQILHQTGEKDHAEVAKAYAEAGYDPQCCQAFIDDMAAAYAWADLAFCRAGASTVAELCATGLPAILVPFPSAIHDHQTHNARIMVESGAAKLLPETEIGHARSLIGEMLANPDLLARMGNAASKLAHPGASLAVAQEILKLCDHHRQ